MILGRETACVLGHSAPLRFYRSTNDRRMSCDHLGVACRGIEKRSAVSLGM